MAETYEIHLDESGLFEKAGTPREEKDKKDRVRLIGGLIAPPELKKREDRLRERLLELGRKYYKNLKSVTGIHLSEQRESETRQGDLRRDMLEVLRREMSEARIAFLYNLDELNVETETPGARLYRSMLIQLLGVLVYYHPFFDAEDHFRVKLAHRRFPYPMAFDLELAGQGYLKLKEVDGRTFFTAITEADVISIMDRRTAALNFTSRRNATYRMKPYHQWDSPFMAMADTICNTIYHILGSAPDHKELFSSLADAFGPDKLLFYCSTEYEFPFKLMEIFHQGRPDRFIEKYLRFSETREEKDKRPDFHLIKGAVQKSFRRLQNTGKRRECSNIISLADNFLNNREFFRLNDVNVLLRLVKDRMDRVAHEAPDPEWDPVGCRYHDASMRYYNHTANTVRGITHRDKGHRIFRRLEKKDLSHARAFHEFINRASGMDANEFAFKRAIDRLEPVKKKEERLTALLDLSKNEIFGKIYGSLGQYYAFLGRHETATDYFQNASTHLGADNFMQISFRAHLALDMANETAYQKELSSLFKTGGFPGYDSLIDASLDDMRRNAFNLHLLLKGLLTFPPDENTLSEIIENVTNKVNPLKTRLTEHPWELIFIALGRLHAKEKKKRIAIQFWKAASGFAESEDQLTFIMIGHSARAREALVHLENADIREAKSALAPLVKTFQDLKTNGRATGILNPYAIPDKDGIIRGGWFDQVGAGLMRTQEFDDLDKVALRALCEKFIARFTFNYW